MSWKHSLQLGFFLLIISTALCAPVLFEDETSDISESLSPLLSGITAAAVLVLLVFVVIGCVCCQNQGFKSFTEHNGIQLPQRGSSGGNLEGLHADSEFTIFPPASVKFPGTSANGELEHVTFEPLPDIAPRSRVPYERPLSSGHLPRPAYFKASVSRGLSLHDWFSPPHGGNFPRSRLQYLQELGVGWYGQAVEGEAQQITPDQRKTKVVVKILREDASPSEHMYFLHEVRQFRDLRHPNILQLLGQCLETDPFLVLLEYCRINLKSYLIGQRGSSEELLQGGSFLELVCQLTSGLQHMHSKGFIHTDLAARNCLLDEHLHLKIGDYGTSYNLFTEDYYCFGEVAFPLRWSAPESLLCLEKAVETKEVTKEANLWSFGVTLWEIMELGKQPYMELSDDQVVHQVVQHQQTKLEEPKTACLHRALLFQIMQLCWGPPESRPSISKVQALLSHLQQNKDMPPSQAFEERWHTLQQQSFTPRQHNLQFMLSSPETPPLVFESHFNPKSASLQNLRGSLEDIVLRQEQEEEEDKVQHQITLAIQELDDYLASEITSSEISSDTATPEQKELVEWHHLHQRGTEEESDGDSAILCSSLPPAEMSCREPAATGLEGKNKDLEYVSSRDVTSPPSPPPSPSMRCDGNFGCFSSGPTNSDVRHATAFGPAHTLTLLDTPPITPDAFSSCTSPCNSRCLLRTPCIETDLHDCEQPPLREPPLAGLASEPQKDLVCVLEEKSVKDVGVTCEFVHTAQSNTPEKSSGLDSFLRGTSDEPIAMVSAELTGDIKSPLSRSHECSYAETLNLGLYTPPGGDEEGKDDASSEIELVPQSNDSLILADEAAVQDVPSVENNVDGGLDNVFHSDQNSLSNDSLYPTTAFSDQPILDNEEKPFDSILNLCSLKSVNTVNGNSVSGVCNTADTSFQNTLDNFSLDIESGSKQKPFVDLGENYCQNEINSIHLNINLEGNVYYNSVTDKLFGNNAQKPLVEVHDEFGKQPLVCLDLASPNNLLYLDKKISEMVQDLLVASINIACALPGIYDSVNSIQTDCSDNVIIPRCLSAIEDDKQTAKDIVACDSISEAKQCAHNGQSYLSHVHNPSVIYKCFPDDVVYDNNMYSKMDELPIFPDCQACQTNAKGSSNTLSYCADGHAIFDVDILDKFTGTVNGGPLCDEPVQAGQRKNVKLLAEPSYVSDSHEYEIDDILSGLEQDEMVLDKEYSPSSDMSGRKSAEDCTLFLEDLETGNREPIRCCSSPEELLDDELLIVDVETNEAMMLDPVLRTFHEEPSYSDYLHVNCYHPPSRLESIMEESDDASHTCNNDSQMSNLFQASPSNILHSVPPELIFEGDEVLAGERNDTDDDEDSSFQSEEMDGEEEEGGEEECEELEDEEEDANEEFHFKVASPFESDSRHDAAYTPDFESDTDDTSSSTGTSRTSSSGSFECPKSTVQSPVRVFSTIWDSTITPTKSSIKSPEKNKCRQTEEGASCVIGEMKKSVSFHEEDPMVVFSYPPVESEEESENEDVAAEEFTFQIDYSNYQDWDFQWMEEEIPEEELEEATEEDISDARPFCSTPQASLEPFDLSTLMYSLCCEVDSLDSLPSTSESSDVKPSSSVSPGRQILFNTTSNQSGFSEYQTCTSAPRTDSSITTQSDKFSSEAGDSDFYSLNVQCDERTQSALNFYEGVVETSTDEDLDLTVGPLVQLPGMGDEVVNCVQQKQFPDGIHSNNVSSVSVPDPHCQSEAVSSGTKVVDAVDSSDRVSVVVSEPHHLSQNLRSELLEVLIDTFSNDDDKGVCSETQEQLSENAVALNNLFGMDTSESDSCGVDHICTSTDSDTLSSCTEGVLDLPANGNNIEKEAVFDKSSDSAGELAMRCNTGEEPDLFPKAKNGYLDSLYINCDEFGGPVSQDLGVAGPGPTMTASLDLLNLNVSACQQKDFLLASSKSAEDDKQEVLVNLNSQLKDVCNNNFDLQPQANATMAIEKNVEDLLNSKNQKGPDGVLKREEMQEATPLSLATLQVPQNRCADDILEAVNSPLVLEGFWGT